MSTVNRATYLNDHLAGSVVALEMLEHLERLHEGTELARVLISLRKDIISEIMPAAKEAVRGIDEMRHVVRQSARDMAQYNGGLASQVAQQEVRDINRAQRHGPRMAATNEARFSFEQKTQDFMDRLMPILLKIAEKTFNAMERFFAAVEDALVTGLKIGDALLAGVQALIPIAAFRPEILQEIRKLLREMIGDDKTITTDEGWNNLMRSIGPDTLSTVTPMAPPPGPVVGMT